MRKTRDVLRLRWQGGLSFRQISSSLGLGRSTVGDTLSRAEKADLQWPLPEDLDDAALEGLLYGEGVPEPPPQRPRPEWPRICRELRRKGVTLYLLWEEYRAVHLDGYQYSRFCELYSRFARKLSPTMRQVHRGGEKIFVDFSGLRPEIVDPKTGEVTQVELFIGALGASGYTYAEATGSQDLACWIGAHQRMFHFFEGSSAILVPDNLKSGITRPCRYEPGVNRTYEEMAAHYGTVVIPARVRRPKDKPKAELSVLLAQRWILAVLRHRTFFSLDELNEAIWELLPRLNERKLQKLDVSRRDLFEQLDRPLLQPLPPQRYELGEWFSPRVNIDYHVEIKKNYYSVPYTLVREKVESRVTATTVEILFKDKRVASHVRKPGRGKYSTQSAHMPAAHRAHLEWTPSRLIHWAQKAGPATREVVTHILETRPHPEQGYRACLGIMRLGKTHGDDRLEAASARAIHLCSFSYQTVKNILASGTDRLPLDEETDASSTPAHGNVRGPSYYASKEVSC